MRNVEGVRGDCDWGGSGGVLLDFLIGRGCMRRN
jgi:hypothetical protein